MFIKSQRDLILICCAKYNSFIFRGNIIDYESVISCHTTESPQPILEVLFSYESP